MNRSSFSEGALIESHACRTGIRPPSDITISEVFNFENKHINVVARNETIIKMTIETLKSRYGNEMLEDGIQLNPTPQNSLAQHMANHLRIDIKAYITRTDYSHTWGSKIDRLIYKGCDWGISSDDWCEKFGSGVVAREFIFREHNGVVFDLNGAIGDVFSDLSSTPFVIGEQVKIFRPQ